MMPILYLDFQGLTRKTNNFAFDIKVMLDLNENTYPDNQVANR